MPTHQELHDKWQDLLHKGEEPVDATEEEQRAILFSMRDLFLAQKRVEAAKLERTAAIKALKIAKEVNYTACEAYILAVGDNAPFYIDSKCTLGAWWSRDTLNKRAYIKPENSDQRLLLIEYVAKLEKAERKVARKPIVKSKKKRR